MTFRTIPNGRLVDGAKLDNLPADVNAELASKADIVDLNAHKTDFNNPHSVTKSQVGLGNVDNTSDADKPVSTATQTALNAKEDKANKGQPNGYAPLDATGKVPAANLPAGTGTGDVVWPASSTDSNVAVFDGVTGKLVKDGGHSLSEYVPKTTTVNGKALSSDVSLTASDVGAISDAPIDGKQYARKNATWSEVVSSGGGGQVDSVVAGTNISVNSTDPINPVVSLAPDVSGINGLTLDTTPTAPSSAVGTLRWNADEDTLDIRQSSSILQVGQEQQWNVRNATASTILEGTPVYVTGTIGASGRMTVAPFIADGSIPSMYYLGVMTQDVLPWADGKATTFGKIRQINTSMWNDGDVLYCSTTVAGQLTNVKPSTPNYVIPTAFVIHSARNGTIAVRVPTLHEADEVNYSNAVSLLTASNVQDAIDELNFEKVNKTTTVNGYSLATDVTLTAPDVGAPSGSGTSTGTNTGDQDLSGLVPETTVPPCE